MTMVKKHKKSILKYQNLYTFLYNSGFMVVDDSKKDVWKVGYCSGCKGSIYSHEKYIHKEKQGIYCGSQCVKWKNKGKYLKRNARDVELSLLHTNQNNLIVASVTMNYWLKGK